MGSPLSPSRALFQFSLAHLFFWTTVVAAALGVVLGAPALFLRMYQEDVRGAWLQGQESEITELGGRIIGYAMNSRQPATIDLSKASVDCQWIKERLPNWEYSEVRTILVDASLVEQPDFNEIQKRFLSVRFVVVVSGREAD